MKMTLTRTVAEPGYTIGHLQCKDLDFWTLEDTIREKEGVPVEEWKQAGCTAIPYGTYQVILDFSNRFQKVLPRLLQVPGFTGVRIHSGNAACDTEGCVLVGKNVDPMAGRISNSRAAMSELMQVLEEAYDRGEEIWMEIK